MIALELLRQTGNVEALINLADEPGPLTVSDLSDVMGLHESTVRQRMNELEEAGLVTTEAQIIDGQPVRVWSPTGDGNEVATSVSNLVDDYSAGDASPQATEPSETSTVESDD